MLVALSVASCALFPKKVAKHENLYYLLGHYNDIVTVNLAMEKMQNMGLSVKLIYIEDAIEKDLPHVSQYLIKYVYFDMRINFFLYSVETGNLLAWTTDLDINHTQQVSAQINNLFIRFYNSQNLNI